MVKSFKPRSVREILTEMKDVSDLMIDLAYAAVLFESDELADRVRKLETRMDELMYHIQTIAAVVTRNVYEARKITGILQVASAAEAISNATGDIADLVSRKIKIHPVACAALQMADEKIAWIEVTKGSTLVGKKFFELKLPSSMGVWTFAIKRGKSWIVPPLWDTEVRVGDALIVKGPSDGIASLCKEAGARREVSVPREGMAPIRNALAKMRDLSSVNVDMAYSAILLGSREIAEEVRKIEEKFDKLAYKLSLATLKAAKEEEDIAGLNGLLQIIRCMERISDAADSIADIVLRRVELHPVFARALSEADEQTGRADVSKRSDFVDKSLKELNLWTTMGAYVLMIKRGERYIFDPSRRVRIRVDDSLIVRGSRRGVQKVKRAAVGGKR